MFLLRRCKGCKHLFVGVVLGISTTAVFMSLKASNESVQPVTLGRLHRSDYKPHENNVLPSRFTHPRMDGRFMEADHPEEGEEGVAKGGRFNFDDPEAHGDDDSLARELTKQVRVLCMVITAPQNLDKRTVHVRDTWGRRCNKLLFFSSTWNTTIPTIGLNVSEGRNNLTPKYMHAYKYVIENHMEDADWFLKADDDTYVIMENLRYFLSFYNTDDPIFFGQIFQKFAKQGYPSGGSGFVLSKEALRRLAVNGFNASLCRQTGTAADAAVGQCMEKLGVKLLPTTDSQGRTTFHCFGVGSHVHGSYPKWYTPYDPDGSKKRMANMSDWAISFHYIGGPRMHEMEYFIYHLRPYGILPNFPAMAGSGGKK